MSGLVIVGTAVLVGEHKRGGADLCAPLLGRELAIAPP